MRLVPDTERPPAPAIRAARRRRRYARVPPQRMSPAAPAPARGAPLIPADAPAPPRRLELRVPITPQNPLNGSLARAHWSVKRKWIEALKAATWTAIYDQVDTLWYRSPEAPRRITFTLEVAQLWDTDALPAACKPIRDALLGRPVGRMVMLQLVHSDGARSGHRFRYRQVKVARGAPRGYRVQLEPLGPAPKR